MLVRQNQAKQAITRISSILLQADPSDEKSISDAVKKFLKDRVPDTCEHEGVLYNQQEFTDIISELRGSPYFWNDQVRQITTKKSGPTQSFIRDYFHGAISAIMNDFKVLSQFFELAQKFKFPPQYAKAAILSEEMLSILSPEEDNSTKEGHFFCMLAMAFSIEPNSVSEPEHFPVEGYCFVPNHGYWHDGAPAGSKKYLMFESNGYRCLGLNWKLDNEPGGCHPSSIERSFIWFSPPFPASFAPATDDYGIIIEKSCSCSNVTTLIDLGPNRVGISGQLPPNNGTLTEEEYTNLLPKIDDQDLSEEDVSKVLQLVDANRVSPGL